jgi:hypothetical protein
MTDENGNLSIDFLAGFTIFMLAFIWVVSMIPGLMIGLQSYTIDYDAVAYRTGVILVEDPGWPVSPPWESFIDQQKSNVTRFGLAISKDTPNILSEDKVNRFFCATAFIYPDDYRTRVIFGDYPYGFNISLIDDGGKIKSVGDVLPNGYGYIRRPVKIKGASFATINNTDYMTNTSWYIQPGNATTHVFSILIDNPKLLGDITDPAYQIDPAREQITINITDLRSTITNYPLVINNTTSTVTLSNIRVYKQDGGLFSNVPLPASEYPYIDGSSTRISTMPHTNVADNITLRFSPQFFDRLKAQSSKIYIALGFTVDPPSTFLNNTRALPDFNTLDGQLTFNNPNATTSPFYYDYTTNVTQPHLRDAVVEVAVWSGAVTSYGGGGPTPINGTHTIYASASSGGTISPSGSVIVSDGANQPFMITNNTGYHISDVVVDGVSNGTISSYIFSNVTQDHTIAASFAIDQYTITPSVIGGNGTISPATVQTVNYGTTPTFTITPNPFYHITDVSVNGISVGTVTSYTFPAVTANYTINASFALGPAPAFTSITPASGPTVGGTPVTIVGTNFVAGGSFGVTIGGAAATSVVWVDSSHITAVTPAGTAGAQDVVIINNDGQTATGIGAYTYTLTPITAIDPITGTPQVGSLLTAGALTPAGATATYQWQRATTSGGTYSDIAGATLSTYTSVAGDGGYFIKVVATGTGSYTGTVTSAYVGPVTIIPIIQTFTASGTSTVPQGAISVDYCVVGGGGGGGQYGGGGGAGGFRTGTLTGLSSSYAVTVGAGGLGATGAAQGASGTSSIFATISSAGGGGGGTSAATRTGANGGSGGGGIRSGNAGGTGNTPAVAPSQGNNGGAGSTSTNYFGGGGGGAGGSGIAASGTAAGNGGAGSACSINGVIYAGGGGGGAHSVGTAGTATNGGGGGGDGAAGISGTVNSGGGGGGGGNGPSNGGNGGSGIVIVRYY